MNQYKVLLENLGFSNAKLQKEIESANSKVLKCEINHQQMVAIKLYTGLPNIALNKFERECKAITFLTSHGFTNIPKLIAKNLELKVSVFEWIDGEVPKSNLKTLAQILNLVDALKSVFIIDPSFNSAIDSIVFGNDLVSQILTRLQFVPEDLNPELKFWWQKNIELRLNKYLHNFDGNVAYDFLTYSPSDLGTHNMIETINEVFFIDFEYFGKDSIYKLLGDFILHPRNTFNNSLIQKFLTELRNIHQFDYLLVQNIIPLLSLKWALIAFDRELKDNVSNRLNLKIQNFSSSKAFKYLRFFDELLVNPKLGLSTSFFNFR